MKILFSAFITAMGFILGMVLAGVGGLSAKTLQLLPGTNENTKKIERYWQETQIDFEDIAQLISDSSCKSSELYFKACLNAIVENTLRFDLKLNFADGRIEKLHRSERLDEKTEKDLLLLYSNHTSQINFSEIINGLLSLEIESRRPFLAAQIINSFLSVYSDPHTYIMPANFYDEVGSKLLRSKYFVGISYEKTNGEFYIRKISKNSDAEISGLKAGDKVLKVNSLDLSGASYGEMTGLLRNENLPNYQFVIQRKKEMLNIEVKRTFRELSHVQYNELQAEKSYGLITLSKFNSGACVALAAELKTATMNKTAGLILDLRDNPGGQLNEAACIAGLFLGKNKKAYYVEYFDHTKANEVVLTSEARIYDGPLVVLVNSASASAAELVAGGLQEYKRAFVIGEMTFGKGTFQESEEWLFNPKVSLYKTQGFYLLPSRNSTQLVGVKPDVELHAEDAPVKREKVAFFNPVKVKTGNYAKLKNSEVVEVYTYSRCNNAEELGTDDLYLQAGIRYLSCAQVNAKLATSDTGKSTTRSF